jgi:hypothetical protein
LPWREVSNAKDAAKAVIRANMAIVAISPLSKKKIAGGPLVIAIVQNLLLTLIIYSTSYCAALPLVMMKNYFKFSPFGIKNTTIGGVFQ